MTPIRHHPDEAGLLGAVHLALAWTFGGHGSLLAIDIRGSNIRAGVVATNARKTPGLSARRVVHSDVWRHANDSGVLTIGIGLGNARFTNRNG